MLFSQLLSSVDPLSIPPSGPVAPTALSQVGSKRKIIVIGAGMAGLVAAFELEKAGHAVTVVEARDRVGGRIMTQRDARGGVLAETGAGRIPSTHDWTNHYIAQMGLETEPLVPTGLLPVVHIDGNTYPVGPDMDLVRKVGLLPDERKAGLAGLARHGFGDALDRLLAQGPATEPPAGFDDCTAKEFLRARGLSAKAVKLLTLGVFPDGISLVALLRALLHLRDGRMLRIPDGNDRLPAALSAALEGETIYRAAVRSVRQHAAHVDVSYVRDGQRTTLSADAVICTVPYSVIGTISFEPALSEEKQTIIGRLNYVAASKVFLKMRQATWAERGYSGFVQLDSVAELWAPRLAGSARGAMIQYYQQGDRARSFDLLDEQERVALAADLVERIFPGSRQDVEYGQSYSWHGDPWARGAYVVRGPGDGALSADMIGRREGRLHFAGEHASDHPGWIEGAIRSGYRAAREVASAA